MKKQLLIISLLLSFFTALLFSDDIDVVTNNTKRSTENIITILKNSKLSDEAKKKDIKKILLNMFDYSLMSRISLSKTWKTLSKAKKQEFISTFKARLEESYASKMLLFTSQKLEVQKAVKIKKNRLEIATKLIDKEKTYEIKYKFYKNKNNKWMVYDASISGISIIRTYRIQFKDFLKNKTIDELIKTL